MYSKFITLVSLALAPMSMIVMASDSLIVQARTQCPSAISAWFCQWYISTGPRPSSIIPPSEIIAKLEDKISQGQAKANDYIVVGYLHAKVGNTSMSETRLTQGLEIAKKDGNLEGQAIATRALAEVFTATGRRQEAASRVTEARNVYLQLGDRQSVNELNQQLTRIRLSNPRILNNP
jgi:hypothetical protein